MRNFAAILIAVPLAAQTAPSRTELLEALSNAASTFARTAPGLGARELLAQRGRRPSIVKGKTEDRDVVEIPDDFTKHEVESTWSIAQSGPIHEIRTIKAIDSAAAPSEVRHALTLGAESDDDGLKKVLLEDFEHGVLEGAATDFVPMLLLFGGAKQANFEFHPAGHKKLENVPVWVLRYRQISGEDTFTEFRDRSEEHHPAEGEIWLRQSDLLPLKITLAVEEVLSVRYLLRNESEVNYTPSRFGLVPVTVLHRQYLNRDLVVENKFRYSDYTGREINP